MDDRQREIIAAACHSAWFAYAVLALGEDGEPWDTAPAWQKDSTRNAVDFWNACVASYLGAYPKKDVASWARQTLPERSHENWRTYKEREGWVYGSVKDAERKTHPCMVAYKDLPLSVRKKDLVVVEAYLALREVLT